MTIFSALSYKTSKPVHGDIYILRSPEPVFLHNTLPCPSSAFTWQQGVIRSDERWDETYIFAISLSPHRLMGDHHALQPCQGLRTGNPYPKASIKQHIAGRCGARRADSHEIVYQPRWKGWSETGLPGSDQGKAFPCKPLFHDCLY